MGKQPEGFFRTALEAAKLNGDQTGKIFVITGAYSGIANRNDQGALECQWQSHCGRSQQEFIDSLKKDYDPNLIDGHLIDLGGLH